MSTTATIDLQAGRYKGDDVNVDKALAEVRSNWTRLKNQLTEGGLPSLMVRITSGYSSGYSWEEVYEVAAGTFSTLTGGRVSGAGGWPKAFETNGGTTDFTNAIVELRPSSDVGAGSTTTVSFDGHAARLAANDLKTIPSGPTYVGTTLTVPYATFEFDLFGRSTGKTNSSYTVEIVTAAGGIDLKNVAVDAKAGATFINLPVTNLTSDIFEFVANGAGGDLQFKTGPTARMVLQWDVSGGATWDWVRGHP